MSAPCTTANLSGLPSNQVSHRPASRTAVPAKSSAVAPVRRQLARAVQLPAPLVALTAAAHILSAGPASAIDFQQPLALQSLSVEWARVAEHSRKPNAVINGLSAIRADIADAVNPANPASPAQDIANKVIEQVQPTVNTAQKVADVLGNPDTAEAPKPSDYFPTSPPELLSAGRDALVSRLQKDILPKIENQISELAKQDDPNEVTVTITNQLKAVRSDINKLAVDVKAGDGDAIQADASGLQQQFDALRKAIPRLNPKK